MAREQYAIDQGQGTMAGSASQTIYGAEAVPASAVAQVLRRRGTKTHAEQDAGEGRQRSDHGVAALPHDKVIPVAAFVDDVKRKVALRKVMFDMKNPAKAKQAEASDGDDQPRSGEQWDKDDRQVNYRYSGNAAKSCGVCKYFIAPGECEIVAGLIRPVDVCDQFEPLEAIMQRAQIRPSSLVTPEYLGEVAAVILARQLREQDNSDHDGAGDCADYNRDIQGRCPDDPDFDAITAGLYDQYSGESEGGPGSGIRGHRTERPDDDNDDNDDSAPEHRNPAQREPQQTNKAMLDVSIEKKGWKQGGAPGLYFHPDRKGERVTTDVSGNWKHWGADKQLKAQGNERTIDKLGEGGPGSGPQPGGGKVKKYPAGPGTGSRAANKATVRREDEGGPGSGPRPGGGKGTGGRAQSDKERRAKKDRMAAVAINQALRRAGAFATEDEGGPGSGPQPGGGSSTPEAKWKNAVKAAKKAERISGIGSAPAEQAWKIADMEKSKMQAESKSSEGGPAVTVGMKTHLQAPGGTYGMKTTEPDFRKLWDKAVRDPKFAACVKAAEDEVSPPGWSGSVKAMKKHGDISNPWALAWWMKGRGATPHYPPEKASESLVTVNLSHRVLERMIRATAARLVGGG